MSAMSQHQVHLTESLLDKDTWKGVRTLLVIHRKDGSIVFINGERYPDKIESHAVYRGSLPDVIGYAFEERRRSNGS